MKRTWVWLGFFLIPPFASAELTIEPVTGNTKVESRLEAMRSASSARSARSATFPTFEQFNESVARAKSESGMLQKQAVLESPSRAMVEKLGCKLENQTPSGVERKDGRMNGVMSVYLCRNGYLVTYESNYEAPLTQRVTVYDDDYAKKRAPNDPLIKEVVAARGTIRLTSMRWLNSDNEIKYEVFTDLEKSESTELESSLKAGLKEVAISLSAVAQ